MSHPQLTSEQEVVTAIKDVLRDSGHLNKMQAELRSKITYALQARQSLTSPLKPPTPCDEIALTNDLIREYLEWNGYLYTASVMASEAGLPEVKKTRQELCLEVGVKDDERSSSLPLLTNIVGACIDRLKRKINKAKKDG